MRMKRALLLFLACAVLMACDGDEPGPVTELPGDPVCVEEVDEVGAEFVGLSEEAALDLADERGLTPREVGRDGECFPVTMDLREDRINLEFIDDVVVGAAVY